MSQDLTEDDPIKATNGIGTLNVTSFFGGEDLGTCLQFTISDHDGHGKYIQLSRSQVLNLTMLLMKWLMR